MQGRDVTSIERTSAYMISQGSCAIKMTNHTIPAILEQASTVGGRGVDWHFFWQHPCVRVLYAPLDAPLLRTASLCIRCNRCLLFKRERRGGTRTAAIVGCPSPWIETRSPRSIKMELNPYGIMFNLDPYAPEYLQITRNKAST